MTTELESLPKSTQCNGCSREVRALASIHIEYSKDKIITYVLCFLCVEEVRETIDRL